MNQDSNDIVRNVLIGATASVPSLGGLISYLLDKSIPSYISNQYKDFIEKLEKGLYEVHRKANKDAMSSPQFITLCYKAIEYAVTEYFEEKRQDYRNIIVNGITGNINFAISDFYLQLIERLTENQFKILNIYYITQSSIIVSNENLMHRLMNNNPENRHLIMSAVSELDRLCLVHGKKLSPMGMQFCRFINTPVQCIKIDKIRFDLR